MKAKKLFLLAIAMVASSSAFAQFSNGGSTSSFGGSGSNEDYNRVTVSYVMQKFDFDGYSTKSDLFEPFGVSLGLVHGQSLSATAPIYLEYGANLTWLHSSDESDEGKYSVEQSLNILDVAVPINLAYKINVSDEFSIVPFVGPSARINILASSTTESGDHSESGSFFDKDDVGSKEAVWNRFQIGGQVGVGINYNQYYFGYQYQWDFMELAKKTTTSRNFISVGMNF